MASPTISEHYFSNPPVETGSVRVFTGICAVLISILLAVFTLTYISVPDAEAQEKPSQLAGQQLKLTGVSEHGFTISGTYQQSSGATLATSRGTSVFSIELGNGRKVQAYCLEPAQVARFGATGEVVPWSEFGVLAPAAQGRDELTRQLVTFIAEHSYPVVSLTNLQKQLPASVRDLSAKEAITATQAAIWHFTDGFHLSPQVLTEGAYLNQNVTAQNRTNIAVVYEYLIKQARASTQDRAAASAATSYQLRFNISSADEPEYLSAFQITGRVPDTVSLQVSSQTGQNYQVVDERYQAVDLTEPIELSKTYYLLRPAQLPAAEKISLTAQARIPASKTYISVPTHDTRGRSQSLLLVDQQQNVLTTRGTVNFTTEISKPTPTPSPSPSPSPSKTRTPAPTSTPTSSSTPEQTVTVPPTQTPSTISFPSPSFSPTASPSASGTPTPSTSLPPSVSASPSLSPSVSNPSISSGPAEISLVVSADGSELATAATTQIPSPSLTPTSPITPAPPKPSDQTLANTGFGSGTMIALVLGAAGIAGGVLLLRAHRSRQA